MRSTSPRAPGRGERGGEHELGGVGGAGLDEAPVPRREPGRLVRTAAVFGEVVEGAHREAGRVVAGVAGDEGEAVHEREGAVVGRERREHVGHGDEHGEAGAPAGVAVAGAEGDAAAHDLVGGDAGFEEAEHRLGEHEREAELEAVVETLEEVRDGIVAAAGLDEDVVAVDRHQEAAGVVGEGVEGAAGDEVEAGVVPVAGDQARLDGALVEREAHVGAAVLDRPGAVLTPEDDDREVADLGQQPTGGLEFRERPGTRGHEFEGRATEKPGRHQRNMCGACRCTRSDEVHEQARRRVLRGHGNLAPDASVAKMMWSSDSEAASARYASNMANAVGVSARGLPSRFSRSTRWSEREGEEVVTVSPFRGCRGQLETGV